MDHFIGIDIGTSNVKIVLFNDHLEYVHSLEQSIDTSHPEPDFAEQDAEEIYAKCTDLLIGMMQYSEGQSLEVKAISISAAMHSFLPVNIDFRPLCNAMIWSDLRSKEYVQRFNKDASLINNMNVPRHPMLPLFKWQWWRDHVETEALHKVLSIKDYVLYQWTEKCITDVSTASATGFFNVFANDWDTEILGYSNLNLSQLPEIKPTTFRIDSWKEEIKRQFKEALPPIIIGATDGCLANLAAGVKNKNMASLTIGTSSAIRTAITSPIINSKIFTYPVSKKYFVHGGALNNGGNVVEWLKNTFFQDKDFWKELKMALSEIQPGSEGLLFLPFLYGERAPFWNPDLKGSFIGLSHGHSYQHFIKSTLEGICFALKHVLSILDEKEQIEVVIIDGGFVKSREWVQLLGNVLGKKLWLPKHSFGAALGAAILAKVSLNDSSLEEEMDKVKFDFTTIEVDKLTAEQYENLYQNYLKAVS